MPLRNFPSVLNLLEFYHGLMGYCGRSTYSSGELSHEMRTDRHANRRISYY